MKDQGSLDVRDVRGAARELTGCAPDAISSSMRLGVSVLGILVGLAACHSSSSGGAAASSEAGTPASSTSAAAGGPIRPAMSGARRPGEMCDPETQSAVCSPDGKVQRACSLGHWQTVVECDGPAGCTGEGEKIVCDLKPAKEGDPCTGGLNPPRCNDEKTLMQCMNHKWSKLVCNAPGKCRKATLDMPSGCRL